jgi:hypothetical protein
MSDAMNSTPTDTTATPSTASSTGTTTTSSTSTPSSTSTSSSTNQTTGTGSTPVPASTGSIPGTPSPPAQPTGPQSGGSVDVPESYYTLMAGALPGLMAKFLPQAVTTLVWRDYVASLAVAIHNGVTDLTLRNQNSVAQ